MAFHQRKWWGGSLRALKDLSIHFQSAEGFQTPYLKEQHRFVELQSQRNTDKTPNLVKQHPAQSSRPSHHIDPPALWYSNSKHLFILFFPFALVLMTSALRSILLQFPRAGADPRCTTNVVIVDAQAYCKLRCAVQNQRSPLAGYSGTGCSCWL